MRLIMKSVTVIGQEALKLVKAGYDSGMSWFAVAKQMGIRFLLEQQRAELYASANAALYDKLVDLQKRYEGLGGGQSAFPQDQLRPGDPRRDFHGGVPHTFNSSAASTGSETPSVSNTPKEAKAAKTTGMIVDGGYSTESYTFPDRRTGPTTTAVFSEPLPPLFDAHARLTTYDPTPESRARVIRL